MSEPFDPYYHWLGIPPQDQPPNLYRLLQLQLFEPNPDVIQNAVDRTMVHLRTFQTGRRAAESQKLLNEVARAKICLLDPAKKAAYDAQLRAQLQPAMAPPVDRPPSPAPVEPPNETSSTAVQSPRVTSYRPRRRQRRQWSTIVLLIVVMLVLGGAAWYVLRRQLGRSTPHTTPLASRSATGTPSRSGGKPQDQTSSSPSRPTADSESAPQNSTTPDKTKNGQPAGTATPSSANSAPTPKAASVPLGAASRKPLAPSIAAAIETADGVVTPQLALVADLDWNDLRPLAERMRPYGYRPIRVRPFVRDDRVYVAALWHRDDAAWRIEIEDSGQTLSKLSASLVAQAFMPTDIAGFATDRTHYVAVFTRATTQAIDVQVDIGLDRQQRERIDNRRKDDGYTLVALQEFVGSRGRHRYCEIWRKAPALQDWFRATGILYRDRPMFADLKPPFCPLDFTMSLRDQGSAPVVVWSATAVRATGPSAILSGFDAKKHMARAAELAQQGYEPIAIAALPLSNRLMVSSAWRLRAGVQLANDETIRQFTGGLPALEAPLGTASSTAAGSGASSQRLPIPADKQLRNAMRPFEQKYGKSLQKSGTVAQQIEMISNLVSALDSESDPVLGYLLCDTARQQAIKAGCINLALRASTALATRYEVDGLALQEETIRKLLPQVKTRAARYALAALAFELSERARSHQQYEIAEQLAATARKAAVAIHDKRLMRASLVQQKRLAADRQLHTDAGRARTVLKDVPNDADAHLQLGKYLCFIRGQWIEGLAHLAKGSDQRLAALAEAELRAERDAKAQLALAQQWDNWSKGQAQELLVGGLQRALHWYVRAVRGLQPEPAAKAERSLLKADDRLEPWLWSAARKYPWFDGSPGILQTLPGKSSGVSSVAAPRNARLAVIGYRDGTLAVWDLIAGRLKWRTPSLLGQIQQVVMADNSPIVLCRGRPRELVLYNLLSRQGTKQRQQDSIIALAAAKWQPVFAWAVATSHKNNVVAWHSAQGGRHIAFTAPNPVHAVAVAPDGRTVIVGDNHAQLISWDLATGKELGRMTVPSTPTSLDVSPDGRFLLIRVNNKLFLYSAADGNQLGRLPDHYQLAAFLPRLGRLIAVGGAAGQIDIWNMSANAVEQTLVVADHGQPVDIRQLFPLADPRAVLVSSRSGNAYVVRLPD